MVGLGAMDAPMAKRILDGVWINAIEVFDGKDCVTGREIPGQTLDKFGI